MLLLLEEISEQLLAMAEVVRARKDDPQQNGHWLFEN
jgi:hypothetical protein